VEWNGKSVSIDLENTLEEIQEKIKGSSKGTVIGDYEIRKGPYGLYMFKQSAKGPARKFVSVPDSLNLGTVTEKELAVIFQAGLKQKAQQQSSDRGRGGFRGRGRGRARA